VLLFSERGFSFTSPTKDELSSSLLSAIMGVDSEDCVDLNFPGETVSADCLPLQDVKIRSVSYSVLFLPSSWVVDSGWFNKDTVFCGSKN
jgi:hypothetical protein